MSPFSLEAPKRVSCWAEGRDNLEAHAHGCACPCPPCQAMQFDFAKSIGELDADSEIAFTFIYALGSLRVAATSSGSGSSMMKMYFGLCREKDVREPEPRATMGWLIAEGDALRVVRAPSDPWQSAATEALEAWAKTEGQTLLIPGHAT